MIKGVLLTLFFLCTLKAQEQVRPPSSLAVANRILANKNATLDQLISADTYIQTYSSRISGLLRFRWFQILDRATQHPDFTASGTSDKYRSWAARSKVMAYFEPGAEWYIPQDEYWRLFQANATAAWAEELAWFAVTRRIQSDECYAQCILERVVARPLQYWTRYPSGRYITEALKQAAEIAEYTERAACERTNAGIFEMTFVSPNRVNLIRSSLASVSVPAQSALLRTLDRIEVKCRR